MPDQSPNRKLKTGRVQEVFVKERIATEARRESRRQGNGTNPGGSGFTDEIGEAGDVQITGFRTVDVVREYFSAHSPLSPLKHSIQ